MFNETKLDENFKEEFKLSFIKSLKLGYNIDEIRKELKKQSYPSDLINRLIEEFESDEDIIRLLKREEKPSIWEIIKSKFFKLNEEQKIKRIVKIHSIFYNLLIDTKKVLNQNWIDIDNILGNLENKKLILYFAKMQENWINNTHKIIHKIRNIAKTLMGEDIKQEIKDNVNNILDIVEKEEEGLDEEILNLKQIKDSINSIEEVKNLIENEKDKLKQRESALQKVINQTSKKSSKFKEVISQI